MIQRKIIAALLSFVVAVTASTPLPAFGWSFFGLFDSDDVQSSQEVVSNDESQRVRPPSEDPEEADRSPATATASAAAAALPPVSAACRDADPGPTTPGCRMTSSDVSPFMVSAGDGQLSRQNLRNLRDPRNVMGYLPQNSIVRRHPDSSIQNSIRTVGRNRETLVPVKVLSVPHISVDQNARLSKRLVRDTIVGTGVRATPQARGSTNPTAGSEGYVPASALQPVDEFTFIVSQDSPFLSLPGIVDSLGGRALKVARDARGCYKVNRCCVTPPPQVRTPATSDTTTETPAETAAPACVTTDNYFFELLKHDLTSAGREFQFNPNECTDFLSGVRPVANSQAEAIYNIMRMTRESLGRPLSSIEMIDSRGFVKIPVDADTSRGPYNSYHYSPDGGTAVSYDAFANSTTACAFIRVLDRHNRECASRSERQGRSSDGCEVQWGDAFHPDSWGVHRGHDDGTCIDLRPLKKEGDRDPVRVSRSRNTNYDWERTRDLVLLMERAGATTIFFNDQRIPDARFLRGHHDHIHVCFDPQDQDVQRTCREGRLLDSAPARAVSASQQIPRADGSAPPMRPNLQPSQVAPNGQRNRAPLPIPPAGGQ